MNVPRFSGKAAYLILLGIFCWPVAASATVTISEIAWMGSLTSANHEWIELHNDGDAIDVSGWQLTDGSNLTIELTGVISGHSYVVLERTSDDSAPGQAFLVYAGALVNGGSTLRLERADGSLLDQVAGGENWQNIGGDNETKATAQYTAAGWVTAVATPGAPPDPAGVQTKQESPTKSSVTSSGALQKPKLKEEVNLVLPGITLSLEVFAPTLGYVNQPVNFTVVPSGIGTDLIPSLQYDWNFGDGFTGKGKEIDHIFRYPGTYVVLVYGGYKRQEQVARHEITVLPVSISLTTNADGDVQVNNDSPYEVDLSNYRLRGEKVFEFPPRTILLPNQTITVPKSVLGKTVERLVGVYDVEGILLASVFPPPAGLGSISAVASIGANSAPTPRVSSISYVPLEVNPKPATSQFTFADENKEQEIFNDSQVPTQIYEVPASEQLASAGAASDSEDKWPYLALVATLVLGTFGVYLTPKRNQSD